MKKQYFVVACMVAFVALFASYQVVLAHESITVGNYELEVGWLTEPPIVGQQNAIVVNVSDTSSGEAQPVENVLDLTVTVSYGGQSRALMLQPLGEDTPGQFIAPILPSVEGLYTIILGGKLGDTAVSANVNPEDVKSTDLIQFPIIQPVKQNSIGDWLPWLGVVLGLIGIGLGAFALRKTR